MRIVRKRRVSKKEEKQGRGEERYGGEMGENYWSGYQ